MAKNHNAILCTLGDRSRAVDGSGNDSRGRQVKDNNGDGIGPVADLVVDDRLNTVRLAQVEHGGLLGFGETKSVLPVNAVAAVTEGDVFVDRSRERIAAAPGHTPSLVDHRLSHSSISTQYACALYWARGAMYPAGPATVAMPLARPRS